MRYPTLSEVVELHRRIVRMSGGSPGIRDLGALESALAQPRATFELSDLYPTLVEKIAALGFSLVRNHPFVDGNKRTAHAAMEVYLLLNGSEIEAEVADQEALMIGLAEGRIPREELIEWLRSRVRPLK
jgi:death-on-curing protein